jgi:hypothetical protein
LENWMMVAPLLWLLRELSGMGGVKDELGT